MTRRHRPSLALAMSTGGGEESRPIMVALRDPDVAYGESVTTLSTLSKDITRRSYGVAE